MKPVSHSMQILLLLCLPACTVAAQEPLPADLEFFEAKVRPVLVEHCYRCHSAGSKSLKGGLRVDLRDGLLKGGDSGPSIVPGDPEKSLLIKAVRYGDDDMLMPPKQKLAPQQITDLELWVKKGAPDPRVETAAAKTAPTIDFTKAKQFWSFQPVQTPALPKAKQKGWEDSPIDRFIYAELNARKLKPVKPADKRALIRRATFDLTGLPPAPEEVESFLNDTAPDAFARVVERLLASPRYGERWGRHWLDVVRYADTAGETADFPVPDAYRYRNYVIDAFNQDKPYDQFIREQIAGDILAANGPREKYAEGVVATGYLAISRRFGSTHEQHLMIEDTLDTLGKSLLGLSVGCARCHDHKYDPIGTADYYALYGFFDSTKYAFPGAELDKKPRDFPPLRPQPEVDALLQPFESTMAALREALKKADDEVKAAKTDAEKAATKTKFDEAKRLHDEQSKKEPPIERAFGVSEGAPKNAKIQRRGEPRNLGNEVPRRFLQVLGGQPLPEKTAGSGRLQLAEWLSSADNPLTARVMVNRIWQHHFGRGIVKTPSDFGSRGMKPTHPALLDYLATRFVAGGWSIKQMHRLIMLSQTYQLSCDDNPKNAEIDPGNEFYWRFNRQRLEAEAIRDSILLVSGQLDSARGGPHPFPPAKDWGFTQHNPFKAAYEHNQRSVYLMTQRTQRHPFLALFDAADPNATTAERRVTTVPTQALFFLNDPFIHAKAEIFAEQLIATAPDAQQRITCAYQHLFARPCTEAEFKTAQDFLQAYEDGLAALNTPPEQRPRTAWAAYARVLFSSNEFIHLD